MVQIFQNRNITPKKIENLKLELINLIRKYKRNIYDQDPSNPLAYSSISYSNIEEYINNWLVSKGFGITCEEIVYCSFKKMEDFILKNIPLVSDGIIVYKKRRNGTYIEIDLFEDLYNYFSKKIRLKIVNELEISVCPYCNQNSILQADKWTNAELDHFFPKSKFPLFSICLENLIPCCHDCNHNKSEEYKHNGHRMLSPFEDDYSTDKLIKFQYRCVSLKKKEIIIKTFNDYMESNVEKFHLRDKYNSYDDIVNEVIFKALKYNKTYINRLLSTGCGKLTNKEIFFGAALTEDKYYLRPLSKFVHDIVEQVQDESF